MTEEVTTVSVEDNIFTSSITPLVSTFSTSLAQSTGTRANWEVLASAKDTGSSVAKASNTIVTSFTQGFFYLHALVAKVQTMLDEAEPIFVTWDVAADFIQTAPTALASIDEGLGLGLNLSDFAGTVSSAVEEVNKYIDYVPTASDFQSISAAVYGLLGTSYTDGNISTSTSGKVRLIQYALGVEQNITYENASSADGVTKALPIKYLGMRTLPSIESAGAASVNIADGITVSIPGTDNDATEAQNILTYLGYTGNNAGLGDFQTENSLEVTNQLDANTVARFMQFDAESNTMKKPVAKSA